MMWGFYIGGKPLAIDDGCPYDEVIVEFSMFRGPNSITWRSHTPYMKSMLEMGDRTNIQFRYGNNYEILLSIKNIAYNGQQNCWDITFVTNLWYHIMQPIEASKNKIKTVGQALNAIKANEKNVKINASEDFLKKELFDGIAIDTSLIDFLAGLANNTGNELYIGDMSINIGYYIGDSAKTIFSSEANLETNTFYLFEKERRKYLWVTSPKPISPYPCHNIKYQDNVYRVIYTNTFFKRGIVTTNVLCTMAGSPIDEWDLAGVLPPLDSYKLSIRLKANNSIFVGKTVKEDEYSREVDISNISYDLGKVKTKGSKGTVILKKSSPYAGPTVGLQFPNNKDAIPVAAKVKDELSSSVEIAQIFQKKTNDKIQAPTRNTPDDFRLTLPDGSTIYYDNTTGVLYLTGKDAIGLAVKPNMSSLIAPSKDSNPDVSLAATSFITINKGPNNDKNLTLRQGDSQIILKDSGKIEIKGKKGTVEMDSDGKIIISGDSDIDINSSGIISVGTLPGLVSKLATQEHMHDLNNHFHLVPTFGPSGPPLPVPFTKEPTTLPTHLTETLKGN